jgi:hypothetical protein
MNAPHFVTRHAAYQILLLHGREKLADGFNITIRATIRR